MADEHSEDKRESNRKLSRRFMLAMSGGTAGLVGTKVIWDHFEGFQTALSFIGKAPDYNSDLQRIVRDGFLAIGLSKTGTRGKTVFLKANLVEPLGPERAATTHPSLLSAVASEFLSLGAAKVMIGDGSAHCRDGLLIAEACGVRPLIKDLGIQYVDLNHDSIVVRKTKSQLTGLGNFLLPASLVHADIVVSIAKMKTHHWAGVTLTMKNLFGVLPGICYGWPKNIFHQIGIEKTILDLTACIRPSVAIIDGIVGMEGDGPIMGVPRNAGVIVMGTNAVATDATAVRLMGQSPDRIKYLSEASGWLGPVNESVIQQRGEPIGANVSHFAFPENLSLGRFSGGVGS